jgi:hypothetical protein
MQIWHATKDINQLSKCFTNLPRPHPPFKITLLDGILQQSEKALIPKGLLGMEEMVLWAGYPLASEILITSVLMPRTDSDAGHITLPKDEQAHVIEELITLGQLLFADAHTHPGNIPLSIADRIHPVGRTQGFLTVIVPYYCQRGMTLGNCQFWQVNHNSWLEMQPTEKREQIKIISAEEALKCL